MGVFDNAGEIPTTRSVTCTQNSKNRLNIPTQTFLKAADKLVQYKKVKGIIQVQGSRSCFQAYPFLKNKFFSKSLKILQNTKASRLKTNAEAKLSFAPLAIQNKKTADKKSEIVEKKIKSVEKKARFETKNKPKH